MTLTPHYADDAVTLYHGDCLDVLRERPDASIDSVVTDPPYGLEFMGKKWDSFGQRIEPFRSNDGYERTAQPQWRGARVGATKAFGEWCERWAAECLRVLKPGGHLLAFGGTRTYHRLTCAIEDAGFEIRDSIDWLYGCLTADAEVLTERGWRLGVEVEVGDRVAQWDAATGSVTLAPVEEVYRAPWDGPMRRLRNADTDQLLTPNHRVYHRPRRRAQAGGVRRAWYDDAWEVAEAGSLSTWNPTVLPLAGEHDGPGVGGEDYAALLGWVWTEGGFDLSGTGVRLYQSSVNAPNIDKIAALLDRLGPHKRYDYGRTYARRNGAEHRYVATTWYVSGALAERVRRDLPGKRPTYPLLWRMTLAEKRAFLRAAMLGDGSGHDGPNEQFTQRHEDDLVWLQTLLALTGRAGKVRMRSNRPNGQVSLRRRGTTELQARHLRDSTADYTGMVWCVRVPTGAFLARRNGLVFVTGNSGFPKSLDVGKAIDRSNERTPADVAVLKTELRRVFAASGLTVDELNSRCGFEASGYLRTSSTWASVMPTPEKWAVMRSVIGCDDDFSDAFRAAERTVIGSRPAVPGVAFSTTGPTSLEVTEPATEGAARWAGWGTALKPAHEPIVVARKPLEGTVAANVVAHGVGALNVHGCRIATDERIVTFDRVAGERSRADYRTGTGVNRREVESPGRWPTNVVLTHSYDCAERCEPDCPVGALDEQSGSSKSRVGSPRGAAAGDGWGMTATGSEYDDAGGASRFFPVFRWDSKAPTAERPRVGDVAHPTVKPLDLMRWLVRLVTPPGGLVLDPFAGSGTTGEACVTEGLRCVLVEREEAYLPLVVTRLTRPIERVLW